jgi:hypothetical protein
MVRTVRYTLLAAGASVLLAAAVWPRSPGLTFTIRTTSSADTAEGAASPPPSTRVQFLDGVVRFDAEEQDAQRNQSPYGKGFYWLVNTTERSMTAVMPARRQYLEVKFDSTAGVILQAMAMSTVVTDIEVSGTALGSGGVVNGYPTKRYRITMSFAEAPSDESEGRRRRVHSVEEFWVTDALKDVPDPMEAFTRAFGGKGAIPSGAGVGSVNELMRKRGDAQRKLFQGLPIKTVATTKETDADGQVTEATATTEIIDLKRVDLDPAAFRVPEGYAKVDVKRLMRDAAAEAAKESAKESAKEGAKDAAKDAIKGIFGRRKKP